MAASKFMLFNRSLRSCIFGGPLSKTTGLNGLKGGAAGGPLSVRSMAGHRVIDRGNMRGDFSYTKWLDNLHLVFMCHAIPIAAIIFLTNLLKGKTELVDIPEDYEPKYWEYYEHPISRWMARWCMREPERLYELNMHNHFRLNEKRKSKILDMKIRRLNDKYQDANTWYFMDGRNYSTHTRALNPAYENQARDRSIAAIRV